MRIGVHPVRDPSLTATMYQLTDRLHGGRSVRVSADGIASTVSAWLAELGADSPLVEDLAVTARNGDWPAAHAIADRLSVDLSVAV
jgi:hypothetical protein